VTELLKIITQMGIRNGRSAWDALCDTAFNSITNSNVCWDESGALSDTLSSLSHIPGVCVLGRNSRIMHYLAFRVSLLRSQYIYIDLCQCNMGRMCLPLQVGPSRLTACIRDYLEQLCNSNHAKCILRPVINNWKCCDLPPTFLLYKTTQDSRIETAHVCSALRRAEALAKLQASVSLNHIWRSVGVSNKASCSLGF
jgi:hypothetical protein